MDKKDLGFPRIVSRSENLTRQPFAQYDKKSSSCKIWRSLKKPNIFKAKRFESLESNMWNNIWNYDSYEQEVVIGSVFVEKLFWH